MHEDYSDNGAGLGASHQTGWTGLVGGHMRILGAVDPQQALEAGKCDILKGLDKGTRAKSVKA